MTCFKTMKDLEDQNNLFGGVDLLTLSACETAVGGGRDATGREVDGLSILVHRHGAKAVIATFWPVADESRALLMAEFYRLRWDKGLSKADALCQAQTALLNGALKPGDRQNKDGTGQGYHSRR